MLLSNPALCPPARPAVSGPSVTCVSPSTQVTSQAQLKIKGMPGTVSLYRAKLKMSLSEESQSFLFEISDLSREISLCSLKM